MLNSDLDYLFILMESASFSLALNVN